MKAIHEGLKELGFKELIRPEIQIGLVASAVYPDDPNWSFQKFMTIAMSVDLRFIREK